MTTWYVKDLSKLTGVSVQTLHHYDRIKLLKPSMRQANGYRLYSESDLLKLQQIVALRFFGFSLSEIKELIHQDSDLLKQFSQQADVLEKKAAALAEGARSLRTVVETASDNKSIPWESVIKTIEVYRMTEQLEQTWVKDIFNRNELKQFVEFETQLQGKLSESEIKAIYNDWDELIKEIELNLAAQPDSEVGRDLGKRFMTWVNRVYGKQYAHLRTKMFEDGFAKGKGLSDVGLNQAVVAWIDQAMDAYWQDKLLRICADIGKSSDRDLTSQWQSLLDELFGDDDAAKQAFVDRLLQRTDISTTAKDWLKSH